MSRADSTERPGTPAPDDPRKPDHPTDLHKRSWGYVLRTTVRQFSRDQCLDLAAALTYYAVLAAAPALLALVSLLGLAGNGQRMVDQVLGTMEGVVPEDVLSVAEPLVANAAEGGGRAGVALVLGVVLALWSASGYVGAFGRAMNRVYEIDEGRPVWVLRPVLLALTLVTVLLAGLVVASLVLTGPVARAVGETVGLGDAAVTVWDIAKWPVMLLLVVLLVAILYHWTPNVRQPRFRWISVGAVVAILGWLVASAAFGVYVSGFSNYGATYGTLAGFVVFLLWMWITNLALLFGAELDSELERGRELQAGIAAEETIQLPPRSTRASEKREARRQQDLARGRALRQAAKPGEDRVSR
ncbi:YihY/virulence factor BrkB family protein [Antribacter gilvus]|uniref:YihY/virulence factor BrkB family protein n=1 Tax=Antribacter gilvus TaxID=2304675 RepID=UPI000F791ABA|nr:YihY/virulence factor BrkB family protein [Antribacter gilvus]